LYHDRIMAGLVAMIHVIFIPIYYVNALIIHSIPLFIPRFGGSGRMKRGRTAKPDFAVMATASLIGARPPAGQMRSGMVARFGVIALTVDSEAMPSQWEGRCRRSTAPQGRVAG